MRVLKMVRHNTLKIGTVFTRYTFFQGQSFQSKD